MSYQCHHQLGSGGTATVFAGKSEEDGRSVALKFFPKSRLAEAKTEYQIGSALNGIPSIVKTYDMFETHDDIVLVLERAEHGDLFDLITPNSTQEFDEDMAQNIILNCARAVAAMHKKNIVHGDIKPENVLLHHGLPLLCDFGFSAIDGTLRHGRPLGTCAYMAPELYTTDPSHVVSRAQDVWSFGVLLYAIIFADLPWERPCFDDPEFLAFFQSSGFLGRNPLFESMSKEMRKLMSRMLALNPEDRCTMDHVVSFFSADQSIFYEGDVVFEPTSSVSIPSQPSPNPDVPPPLPPRAKKSATLSNIERLIRVFQNPPSASAAVPRKLSKLQIQTYPPRNPAHSACGATSASPLRIMRLATIDLEAS